MGDFGKYRYDLQQKAKDAKEEAEGRDVEGDRVSPKIDDHDIDTKIRSAAKFLDEGDKLKVTVRFAAASSRTLTAAACSSSRSATS